MSNRKKLAVAAALLLLLLGLRVIRGRWIGARGGSGAGGHDGTGFGGPIAATGGGGGEAGGGGMGPWLKKIDGWRRWFYKADQPQRPVAPGDQADEGSGAAPAMPSGGAGSAASRREASGATSGLDMVYHGGTVGTLTSPAAPSGLAEVRAAPAAGHQAAGGDAPAQPVVFQGPRDKLPEPNPERPRVPDGPCPRRGWYKSPYTGLCYMTASSCAGATYTHESCFQPNP